MLIQGTGGRLKAGSRHSAQVGAWRLEKSPHSYRATIQVRDVDTYLWTVTPQTLVLNIDARKQWSWSVPQGLPAVGQEISITVQGAPKVIGARASST